jgi:hypothetical protein
MMAACRTLSSTREVEANSWPLRRRSDAARLRGVADMRFHSQKDRKIQRRKDADDFEAYPIAIDTGQWKKQVRRQSLPAAECALNF